jgi:hypothetical protein
MASADGLPQGQAKLVEFNKVEENGDLVDRKEDQHPCRIQKIGFLTCCGPEIIDAMRAGSVHYSQVKYKK